MHYERVRLHGDIEHTRRTADERFFFQVNKTDTCWLWTGTLNPKGYANFSAGGTTVIAHRWAFERFVGPIPDGLHIDHLCRVRRCVNPDHLEAVTLTENNRRSKPMSPYCPHGHLKDGVDNKGKRFCRECGRISARERAARARAAQRATLVPTPAPTHCRNGHIYDEANTYHYRGTRRCRRCKANWMGQQRS